MAILASKSILLLIYFSRFSKNAPKPSIPLDSTHLSILSPRRPGKEAVGPCSPASTMLSSWGGRKGAGGDRPKESELKKKKKRIRAKCYHIHHRKYRVRNNYSANTKYSVKWVFVSCITKIGKKNCPLSNVTPSNVRYIPIRKKLHIGARKSES